MGQEPEFLRNINWELLKEQKQGLLALSEECETGYYPNIMGIIELIDSIQDYATDVMGLSELEVFGFGLNLDDDGNTTN